MWGLCEIDICSTPPNDPWPISNEENWNENDFYNPCNEPHINCDYGGQDGGSGPGEDCSGTFLPAGCDEIKPCFGDPVPNPEIAPTYGSGILGGRYGYTRSGGTQFHAGLDLKASVGSPIYSMFPGTVWAVNNVVAPNTYGNSAFGNYIIVKSIINNEDLYVLYAHLNSVSLPTSTPVNAGTQIGLAGKTGNAADSEQSSGIPVVPHVHIVVKLPGPGNFNDWDTKNPEKYLATTFDPFGNPTPPTHCN